MEILYKLAVLFLLKLPLSLAASTEAEKNETAAKQDLSFANHFIKKTQANSHLVNLTIKKSTKRRQICLSLRGV